MEPTLRTILLVDDEVAMVEVLTELVQSLGYNAIPAYSASETLAHLRAKRIHAVISDINMPEMNGPDMLRQMRGEGMEHPLAFLTGYESRANLIAAIRLGASDFLEKPTKTHELQAVIERLLEMGARQERIAQCLEEIGKSGPECQAALQRMKQELRQVSLLKAVSTSRSI